MEAIVITKKGGPDVLKIQDVDQPVPQNNQVLINIKAAGVNRSDVVMRRSSFYGASDKPEIPGLEIAGIIESVGSEVTRWKVGDKVCTLVAGGGYATYSAVDERLCLPVPEGLSFEEAAGLPETIFTVWLNVFKNAGFQSGENFLIHGGSSGIGVTAIQMVVAMGGKAYATAGTDEKCNFCEDLGATLAINYKTDDFAEVLKPIGIDVILDMTGGENTLKNIDILNTEGRLTFISAMNGNKSEIDIFKIMGKRLKLTGSMLKHRSDDFKAELAAEIEHTIWPLVTAGKIEPIIHQVFPLQEAGAAQQLMESSKHIGKIILKMESAY